jgi:hypothetical protein
MAFLLLEAIMTFADDAETTTPGHTTQQTAPHTPHTRERRESPPPEAPEPALLDPGQPDEDHGYGHGV